MSLLLSKRDAAKLLGIGRDHLDKVIAAGFIRLTPMLQGPPCIARAEVERFALEGAVKPVEKPRAPRRTLTKNEADIAAIEV